MKKQIHILEGFIILTIILIATLLVIKFIYNINQEELDTSYMWNINFTNLKTTEGSEKGNLTMKDNTLNLDLTFTKEESFYEFSFDIENKGTLDAQLTEANIKINNPKNILTSKIVYLNNEEIKVGDIIPSNAKKTIIVRIEYPKQKDKIHEELTLNLSLNFTYKAIQ